MRRTILAALWAMSLCGVAGAADLMQIYRDAVANDPQYAAARNSLLAGQEAYPQGRAGLLPQIGLGVSSERNRTRNDLPEPLPDLRGKTNTSGYTLSLSQPLFRWENFQQYAQSKLSVTLSEAQFAQARQDLILRVAQAYFDVLAAEDAVGYIQAQKAAISEQLESAKRNFEVGTATITDTNEAQARYDLAMAEEIAALNNLDTRRSALLQLVGSMPGPLLPLKPNVQLSAPQPTRMEDWVASAEASNYLVVQQQAAYEIAKRQVQISRAGHYPTLDLVASRSHIRNPSTSTAIDEIDETSVGLQLNVPIFSGGFTQSKVRETLALQDKSQNDLENARRSAAQGARQAYFGVNSGLAQVKAYEAAEVSSLTALESNKLGYEVGVRINIDVLNAQQQLYSTRQQLAQARYETLMNSLRLKSAAGTLTEDDLAEINLLLAPRQ